MIFFIFGSFCKDNLEGVLCAACTATDYLVKIMDLCCYGELVNRCVLWFIVGHVDLDTRSPQTHSSRWRRP